MTVRYNLVRPDESDCPWSLVTTGQIVPKVLTRKVYCPLVHCKKGLLFFENAKSKFGERLNHF